MTKPVRLFIGIALSSAVKSAVSTTVAQIKPQLLPKAVRWEKPEKYHITLKFLGDSPKETLPKIKTAMRQSAVTSPFTLSLDGLGAFPNMRKPRTLWLGLGGETDSLIQLAYRLDDALVAIGFDAGKRPFNPHLTIGRVNTRRKPKPNVSLPNAIAPAPCKFIVSEITLFQTQPAKSGSTYAQIETIQLSPSNI